MTLTAGDYDTIVNQRASAAYSDRPFPIECSREWTPQAGAPPPFFPLKPEVERPIDEEPEKKRRKKRGENEPLDPALAAFRFEHNKRLILGEEVNPRN
ncbi:hypothetical protein, partial [Staphylococcus aureus]